MRKNVDYMVHFFSDVTQYQANLQKKKKKKKKNVSAQYTCIYKRHNKNRNACRNMLIYLNRKLCS